VARIWLRGRRSAFIAMPVVLATALWACLVFATISILFA
jgi:hypothetical protein